MNSRRSRSSNQQLRLGSERGSGLAGLRWKIKVGPSFIIVKKGNNFLHAPNSYFTLLLLLQFYSQNITSLFQLYIFLLQS